MEVVPHSCSAEEQVQVSIVVGFRIGFAFCVVHIRSAYGTT